MQIRLKNIITAVSLVISSCSIALIIGEFYFRFFNPQPIVPRYVETSVYGIRKNIGNVRGRMVTPEYQHNFNTNAQGFRGTKEYAVDKPANVYRIIVLGDSVALGHGVEDNETFSALLEEQLSSERPTEVINMGVSGFGTAEELIQLQNLGIKYDPDIVILTYFQNDPYNNAVCRLFTVKNGELCRHENSFVPAMYLRDRLYKIPGYAFLSQHSHLLNFLRHRFSRYFLQKLGEEIKVTRVIPHTLTDEQATLTALLINKIISITGEKEIPLVVLNIPSVRGKYLINNLPVELIDFNEMAYVVDCTKELYDKYDAEVLAYKRDCHLTPFTHRLIGELLADFIKAELWRM